MYMLSIHPFGCRVMQRLLENCSKEQMKVIFQEVLQHTESLLLVSITPRACIYMPLITLSAVYTRHF